jgi:hypothetical protein
VRTHPAKKATEVFTSIGQIKIMNDKNLFSLILASILLISTAPARAQTGNAPTALPKLTATNSLGQISASTNMIPTPETFFDDVESYFTSFNTNLTTFTGSNYYQMWTAIEYQSGINLGVSFGLEAQPFSGARGLTLGSVSALAPAIGTIAAQEFDVGWSITHYDVRVTAGGLVGYTFESASAAEKGIGGGVFVEAEKALSDTTFAGIRLEEKFGGGNHANQPYLFLQTGFVF